MEKVKKARKMQERHKKEEHPKVLPLDGFDYS
jgi:hypothetical protein